MVFIKTSAKNAHCSNKDENVGEERVLSSRLLKQFALIVSHNVNANVLSVCVFYALFAMTFNWLDFHLINQIRLFCPCKPRKLFVST